MKTIFDQDVTQEVIQRIEKLNPDTKATWGKMNVAQMLAHTNVAYEYIFEPDKYPKPKGFKKFILKKFVKGFVVGDKPYKPNGRTAKEFLMVDEKVFETEKSRLIDYLNKTQELGAQHFDGRESHSFGTLTLKEWHNMFYKHLDHHLKQFGA